MTILLVIVGAAAVIILMAIATMFLGRGRMDADQSVNHYLDEVEVISRNIHF